MDADDAASPRRIGAALRQIPYFADFDAAQVREITESGAVRRVAAGEIIFREGDLDDSLFVVIAGRMRVFRRDLAGREVDLATLDAGQFFGEMALLDQGPRSADVAAIDPGLLFTLGRPAFLRLLSSSPGLLSHLLVSLTTKIRETSHRFFQEELGRRTLEAEMAAERHRVLAQLVAGVAHELNTPLGIATTAISVIRQEVEALSQDAAIPIAAREGAIEDLREATGLTERNLARAHKLVGNFKKVSVGQIDDVLETIALPEAIEDVVNLFAINAKQAKLSIRCENALPEDARWVGYRGCLTQVLLNLLANVERYAYPKGAGGDVVIRVGEETHRHGSGFVLEVRDFGSGIAPDVLQRVFDPFFTTGRGRGGTGLGLAIVRNIVTSALSGSIDISSEVDQGTRVVIRFPRSLTAARP